MCCTHYLDRDEREAWLSWLRRPMGGTNTQVAVVPSRNDSNMGRINTLPPRPPSTTPPGPLPVVPSGNDSNMGSINTQVALPPPPASTTPPGPLPVVSSGSGSNKMPPPPPLVPPKPNRPAPSPKSVVKDEKDDASRAVEKGDASRDVVKDDASKDVVKDENFWLGKDPCAPENSRWTRRFKKHCWYVFVVLLNKRPGINQNIWFWFLYPRQNAWPEIEILGKTPGRKFILSVENREALCLSWQHNVCVKSCWQVIDESNQKFKVIDDNNQ